MSICIISDHLRQNCHYNTQHIDQVKPKYEEGGFSPQSPPPGSAPETSALLNEACTFSRTPFLHNT